MLQLHDNIFQYKKWDYVLRFFDLKPAKSKWSIFLSELKKRKGGKYRKGGKSEEHKRLKKFISKNPSIKGMKLLAWKELIYFRRFNIFKKEDLSKAEALWDLTVNKKIGRL